MRDLLFLVPVLVGTGVIALGAKYAVGEGRWSGMLMGGALILGALFWWWGSALALVWEGKVYLPLDVLAFCFFFWGVACWPWGRSRTEAGGGGGWFLGRKGKKTEYDFRPRPERPGPGVVARPSAGSKGKERWQLVWGVVLLGGGFVLGLAHSCAVMFSGTYREGLLGFYGKLGMTERKPGVAQREKGRRAPVVTPFRFPTPTPMRTPPPIRVPPPAKGG